MSTVLDVKNLTTNFYSRIGVCHAVNDVSFTLKKRRVLGLVGESGCGKTVTSLSIMKLIPSPPGKIESGSVLFNGEDILKKNQRELREIRGKEISMIFQDPMTSLDPVFTIGLQMKETMSRHLNLTKAEQYERIVDILNIVRIPNPKRIIYEYPYQLSGGMKQRVMIAIALSCRPQILIADEPTTALDVTIQAQILDLLEDLIEKIGMSIIIITHDLGVVAEVADTVAVMYAGQIIEYCSIQDVFLKPLHPYTQGLLSAIPTLEAGRKRLSTIKGSVPDLREEIVLCSFLPRCTKKIPICSQESITLFPVKKNHLVRCHLLESEKMEN